MDMGEDRMGTMAKAAAAMACCAAGLAWGQAAQPQAGSMVQPGLWEFTMDAKVPAKPDFSFPAQSKTQCLTQAEADDPSGLLSGQAGVPKGVGACSYGRSSVSGGVLTFELSCSGDLRLASSGTARISASSIEGDIVTSMMAADGMVEFHSHLTGRRLGPCQ